MKQINEILTINGGSSSIKFAVLDKLIEHKQYIQKNGEDMPEVRNWKWYNQIK